MPLEYSLGTTGPRGTQLNFGEGVRAIGAAGSRHGWLRSWKGFSQQGVGGEDLTGKSGCQWQDVVRGERRNSPGLTSFGHSEASSERSGSGFGARDTR